MIVAITVPDDVSIDDAAIAIDMRLGGAVQGIGWEPDATVWESLDDLLADVADGQADIEGD